MNKAETGGTAFPQDAAPSWTDLTPGHPGMSMREYAAIMLRVPDSGTTWLDDMIRSSLRDDFAAKAMQGLLAAQIHGFNDTPANGPFAYMAYEMADAMLKERETNNGK